MTDKKISELTSITGADVSDANDVLPIVDTSVATTKKITRAELFKSVSSVDINGGTIDGTVIGGSTPAAISGTTGTFSGNLTVDTDTLFVDAAANEVGIGTSSPNARLSIKQNGNSTLGGLELIRSDTTAYSVMYMGGDDALYFQNQANGAMAFYTNLAERMRITSSGNVGIGTNGPPNARLSIKQNSNSTLGGLELIRSDTTAYSVMYMGGDDALYFQNQANGAMAFYTSNTLRMTIASTGNVTITGSLSKGSGSFKIDHPIKPDTHHLVHSFIEGPQADNIYRGKVALADGKATVNLDEAARMTEGTFVALNGNVQCFTTNEHGWTAVRGKVEGNILTIEAQDAACADTVSWLVIGERHDPHMIDANWTDEQGRIITEPEKGTAS